MKLEAADWLEDFCAVTGGHWSVFEETEFARQALKARTSGRGGWNQGQAEMIGAAAHELEDGLDGRWIRLPEVGFEER